MVTMKKHKINGFGKAGIAILAFLLSFILIAGAAFLFYGETPMITDIRGFLGLRTATPELTLSAVPEPSPSPTPVKQYEYATIAAVGDILIHLPILPASYDAATDTYDFNPIFKYITKYIKKSDLAVANFETTLGGPEAGPYVGYPMFKSPDSLADALKNAGFGMVTAANNHMYDSGEAGFFRTGKVLRAKGFDVLGTRTSPDQKNYTIREINGIRIGFTDFGYETGKIGGAKSLNGIPLSDDASKLLNSFDYNALDSDYPVMRKCADDMRADGAEFIIFFMHWGDEYQITENPYETAIAQKLADFGVDAVIGGHPHVLQPIRSVWSDISGKNMLVAYSLGNFISNQRFEYMGQRYSEDGMILNLNLKKDIVKNAVSIDNVTYLPTWVHLYYANGKAVYEIVPARDALADPSAFGMNDSPDSLWRVQNSINNTTGIMDPAAAKATAFKISELK
jgi:poly-gamma-glutamate capsule biosynthesis protein CapA/YwtB (metallophosphatase superfamily)